MTEVLPEPVVINVTDHVDAVLASSTIVGFTSIGRPVKIGHGKPGFFIYPLAFYSGIGSTQTNGVVGDGFVGPDIQGEVKDVIISLLLKSKATPSCSDAAMASTSV